MATQTMPARAFATAAHHLPAICFKLAAFTALIGVSMGVYMGLAKDHTLAPVHVHLNLIGWVSMFLFGLFYDARREAANRTAIVQVASTAVGYVTMMSGLAGLMLSGNEAFLPLAIIGSLLVWTGFALFFAIVVRRA